MDIVLEGFNAAIDTAAKLSKELFKNEVERWRNTAGTVEAIVYVVSDEKAQGRGELSQGNPNKKDKLMDMFKISTAKIGTDGNLSLTLRIPTPVRPTGTTNSTHSNTAASTKNEDVSSVRKETSQKRNVGTGHIKSPTYVPKKDIQNYRAQLSNSRREQKAEREQEKRKKAGLSNTDLPPQPSTSAKISLTAGPRRKYVVSNVKIKQEPMSPPSTVTKIATNGPPPKQRKLSEGYTEEYDDIMTGSTANQKRLYCSKMLVGRVRKDQEAIMRSRKEHFEGEERCLWCLTEKATITHKFGKEALLTSPCCGALVCALCFETGVKLWLLHHQQQSSTSTGVLSPTCVVCTKENFNSNGTFPTLTNRERCLVGKSAFIAFFWIVKLELSMEQNGEINATNAHWPHKARKEMCQWLWDLHCSDVLPGVLNFRTPNSAIITAVRKAACDTGQDEEGAGSLQKANIKSKLTQQQIQSGTGINSSSVVTKSTTPASKEKRAHSPQPSTSGNFLPPTSLTLNTPIVAPNFGDVFNFDFFQKMTKAAALDDFSDQSEVSDSEQQQLNNTFNLDEVTQATNSVLNMIF